MWVKICGNTNLEDALLAAELGADAVGFVFAPSSRQVTAAQVAQITPHLPSHLERVGVFPAWSAEQILAVAREAGLTAVQLHGGLDSTLARTIHNDFAGSLRIIHVAHWTETTDASHLEAELKQGVIPSRADRVLIDSKVGLALGGTGTSFNWRAAQRVFAGQSSMCQMILAGGLKPDNVAEAISVLQPWGVDVASGVEARAGKKDPEKLASFIRNAKAVRERS
jgi:phosphoribosylanthranilate isomerase